MFVISAIFLIPCFLMGTLFGAFLLPPLLEQLEYWMVFNTDRAEYYRMKSKKYNARAIRKTKVFKERLNSILSSIAENTKAGEHCLTVTYLDGCATDREIQKELKARKFEVYTADRNALRIFWK